MAREIALDTETTGIDPDEGHRIVEIGCVEMVNRVKTGHVFHVYLNPERDVPEESVRVHGLTADFLADKPKFAEQAFQFLAFLGDSPLVIHNAAFDMRFLNAELSRAKLPLIDDERAVDTVLIARKMFPGAPASLDALCRRFGVDLSARTKHGALLDADLLADVYLELMGGRQSTLELMESAATTVTMETVMETASRLTIPERQFPPSIEERAAHRAFIEKKLKHPVWAQFWLKEDPAASEAA